MAGSGARVRACPTRVAVLLGDPRLPYGYNPSGRLEAHDHQAVDLLRDALAALESFEFAYLDDHAALAKTLARARPDLVLNFCNTGYGNRECRQLHVAALLEMLELPYAGAGPVAIALCHDKALALEGARALGVPVPRQRLVRLPADRPPEVESFPVLVKPNAGDGSAGIDADAVVRSPNDLRRSLERMTRGSGAGAALIQEYLPGAEYSVGLIGNPAVGFLCLPPLEVDYGGLEPGLPRILTLASKVDPGSVHWRGIRLRAAVLAEARRAALDAHCRAVFERLGCRDYARFDFRCGSDGTPRLIDVNAHPMWGAGGMMATMAGFAGLGYAGMLAAILDAASRRLGGV